MFSFYLDFEDFLDFVYLTYFAGLTNFADWIDFLDLIVCDFVSEKFYSKCGWDIYFITDSYLLNS